MGGEKRVIRGKPAMFCNVQFTFAHAQHHVGTKNNFGERGYSGTFPGKAYLDTVLGTHTVERSLGGEGENGLSPPKQTTMKEPAITVYCTHLFIR